MAGAKKSFVSVRHDSKLPEWSTINHMLEQKWPTLGQDEQNICLGLTVVSLGRSIKGFQWKPFMLAIQYNIRQTLAWYISCIESGSIGIFSAALMSNWSGTKIKLLMFGQLCACKLLLIWEQTFVLIYHFWSDLWRQNKKEIKTRLCLLASNSPISRCS